MSRLEDFFSELKRRKVYRVAVIYAAVGFALWQAAEIAVPALALPEWVLTTVVLASLFGFPIALAVAWAYDITPGGVRRAATGDRSMAYFGAGVLVVSVVVAAAAAWWALGTTQPSPSPNRPAGLDPDLPSIAVLPFVDMSPQQDQEYFGDGVAEEILNALTKIPGLKVAARTSAFSFKHSNEDIQSIARQLGVSTVLEGSVRTEGNEVRVTAQLVDAAEGYPIWSERYDRQIESIFAVQDEIAQAVLEAFNLTFGGESAEPLIQTSTEDLKAHDHYLRGRSYWSSRDLHLAIDEFRMSIASDPNFALAHAALAESYAVLPSWSTEVIASEAAAMAEAAASQALSLEEGLAGAHTALAFVKYRYRQDWRGAEREFREAIRFNPGYATAHHWYGEQLSLLGRHEEALAELRRALELDPLSAVVYRDYADALVGARDFARAIQQYEMTLSLDSTLVLTWRSLGRTHLHAGSRDEAVEAFSRYARLTDADPEAYRQFVDSALLHRRTGDRVALPSQFKDESRIQAVRLGWLNAMVGQREKALEWLERAYEERPVSVRRIKVDPAYDLIRDDPRSLELMQKIGLEP